MFHLVGSQVGYFERIGSDPSQIERRERAEQMAAAYRAQAVGQGKVIDDANPKFIGHAEVFSAQARQPLQLKQGKIALDQLKFLGRHLH